MPKTKSKPTTRKPAKAKKRKYRPEIDLTDAQEDFCLQYIGEAKHNASEAYRIAYPQSKKWKDSTVHEHASRLKALNKVWTRIEALQRDVVARNELTTDWLVGKLKRLAALCAQEKRVKNKTGQGKGTYKLDAGGANKAYDTLGRIQGSFEKDNVQKQPVILQAPAIEKGKS